MVVAKVIDVNMGRHGRQESLGGVVGDVTNKAPVTASERILLFCRHMRMEWVSCRIPPRPRFG